MEDEYIRLLKDLRDKFRNDEPMALDGFKKYLKSYKIKQHPNSLYRKIFTPAGVGNEPLHLGLDGYMMLLEYEELNHALKQSRQATRYAITAIVISIAIGIIPVILWLIDRGYFY